jgi:hypothetical protein
VLTFLSNDFILQAAQPVNLARPHHTHPPFTTARITSGEHHIFPAFNTGA